jgi:hypothetical protein
MQNWPQRECRLRSKCPSRYRAVSTLTPKTPLAAQFTTTQPACTPYTMHLEHTRHKVEHRHVLDPPRNPVLPSASPLSGLTLNAACAGSLKI